LWMSSAFCAALSLTVVVLALLGAGERGTDVALQLTARVSFLLFWPAYCGNAVAVLFGPRFEFFKRRARNFGLAFATAHLVHIGLVVWLCQIGEAPPLYSFVFFGVALVWTYLLALLSADRLHQVIGHKSWWLLSTIGLNYIALAFAVDFMRLPFHGDARYGLGYLPFIILAIMGPVLRVGAWRHRIHVAWRSPTFPVH
jgi:hypothetical protein